MAWNKGNGPALMSNLIDSLINLYLVNLALVLEPYESMA